MPLLHKQQTISTLTGLHTKTTHNTLHNTTQHNTTKRNCKNKQTYVFNGRQAGALAHVAPPCSLHFGSATFEERCHGFAVFGSWCLSTANLRLVCHFSDYVQKLVWYVSKASPMPQTPSTDESNPPAGALTFFSIFCRVSSVSLLSFPFNCRESHRLVDALINFPVNRVYDMPWSTEVCSGPDLALFLSHACVCARLCPHLWTHLNVPPPLIAVNPACVADGSSFCLILRCFCVVCAVCLVSCPVLS